MTSHSNDPASEVLSQRHIWLFPIYIFEIYYIPQESSSFPECNTYFTDILNIDTVLNNFPNNFWWLIELPYLPKVTFCPKFSEF